MNIKNLLLIAFTVSLLVTMALAFQHGNWVGSGGVGIHSGDQWRPTWATLTGMFATLIFACVAALADHIEQQLFNRDARRKRETE